MSAEKSTIRDSVVDSIPFILDRERFITRITEALAFHSGFPMIALYTRGRDKREYVLRARTQIMPEHLPNRLPSDRSSSRQIAVRSRLTIPERGAFATYAAVSAPILDAGNCVGMVVTLTPENSVLRCDDVRKIERLVAEIAPAVAICELHHTVEQSAIVDIQTGVHTFQYLDERLAKEVSRASRTGSSIAIVRFEATNLRMFELEAGYDIADHLLQQIAGTIAAVLRNSDVVARRGRAGFVALLPDCDQDGSSSATRRVRQRVALIVGALCAANSISVDPHFATGQAWFPMDGRDASTLMLAAEQRLMEQEVQLRQLAES